MLFRFYSLILLMIILTACSELPYNNLDNQQLKTLLDQNVPVFDIRRPEEWQQTGIIEDSKLLTFVDARGQVKADFMSRFTSSVGKNDPLILICRTGSRTRHLAKHLVENMGYTQVYNVRNGIMQWIQEKQPIKHL